MRNNLSRKLSRSSRKFVLFVKGKPTLVKASGFDIFVRTFGILQLSRINTPIRSLDVFVFCQPILKEICNSYQDEFSPKRETCDYVFFFISDVFFDPKFERCFCTEYHPSQGDQLYYTRGRPPKDDRMVSIWAQDSFRCIQLFQLTLFDFEILNQLKACGPSAIRSKGYILINGSKVCR